MRSPARRSISAWSGWRSSCRRRCCSWSPGSSPTATTAAASRRSRRLVEGCAAAALAYGAFTGTTSKEMILAAAFFLGAGRAGESPTMQTLLPAVVPTALFPRAVGGLVGRAAGRHHHRAGDRRPDLCVQPDRGLRDLLRRCSPRRRRSSRSCSYERAATRTPVTLAGFFAGISLHPAATASCSAS